MTKDTNTARGAAELLALIDAYAEARHVQGHSSYNDHTKAARQAVVAALASTPAQPVAEPAKNDTAYAELPEPDIAVGNDGRALIYTSKDIVGEPYYTAGQLRAFADATHALRASHGQAPAGAAPLTPKQMESGREAIFSTGNPYCPCDSKTFRKVAEWVERHHGIKGGQHGSK